MRLKIIAGNLLAVLIVGLASYFVVRSQLASGLAERVEQALPKEQQLFDRSLRLSSIQFVDQVSDRARVQAVRDVFGGLDENSRRRRAFESANSIGDWFQDPVRSGGLGAPEVVAITDEAGKVIARNLDPNRMYGEVLVQQLPALARVIASGVPQFAVWRRTDENKLLQTGIAPVRNEQGAVIGALIVGYDLSDGLARRLADNLGRDIAFIANGTVYSSSLSAEAKNALTGPNVLTVPPEGSGEVPAWSQTLAGEDYRGITAPMPMAGGEVGYIVLANKTKELGLVSATTIILILTGLGVLLVLVYGFMIGSSFLKPVEQIEEGVLAVINGRTDLRLDVKSAEFGGLAYRINQLINVFTGTAEEDDEGRVSQAPSAAEWVDPAFSDANPGASGRGAAGAAGGAGEVVDDPSIAAQLASEPEDAYYARIYAEYVAAKSSVGENVSNIPQDRFVQRLKGNESSLVKKHGCKMVRFQVHTRGNQVVLTPVLIR